MFFLFIYILFVFLVGMYASRLNRSIIGYVLLSLIISPLITFIILLVLGPTKSYEQEQADKLKAEMVEKQFVQLYLENPEFEEVSTLKRMYDDLTRYPNYRNVLAMEEAIKLMKK